MTNRQDPVWRFLLPSFLFIGVFSLYPIIESFRLSFYRMILTMPWLGAKFVGWENYRDLATDPVARGSFVTSLLFVAVTTPIEVLVGLAMALVLNESFRGRGWLRAIVLIPWAVPTVVSSQMWRFIFNDRYGLFNYLIFGSATQNYWAPLAEPGLALMAVMLADIWKTSSFAGLILLAGLQGIPGELYEAADIDGATTWQKFRHVTLPLLKSALLLALLFRTIDALKVFDLVFVMTQGGPANSTSLIVFYIYQQAFQFSHYGYAAAMASFLVAVLVCLTGILFVVTKGGRFEFD